MDLGAKRAELEQDLDELLNYEGTFDLKSLDMPPLDGVVHWYLDNLFKPLRLFATLQYIVFSTPYKERVLSGTFSADDDDAIEKIHEHTLKLMDEGPTAYRIVEAIEQTPEFIELKARYLSIYRQIQNIPLTSDQANGEA